MEKRENEEERTAVEQAEGLAIWPIETEYVEAKKKEKV